MNNIKWFLEKHLIGGTAFLISLIPAALIAYFSIQANLDLSMGRYALFMDEGLIFDGVHQILHASNLHSLLASIVNGGDQRYGRILWNLSALVSFIPEKLWGEQGQIVATRSLQLILILASVHVIAYGIIKNIVIRIAYLMLVLFVPYTDYYLTMPKPEPIQLLCLSLFFYYYVSKTSKSEWYWIFAGLAFGAKISALPIIFTFITLDAWYVLKEQTYAEFVEIQKKRLLWISYGLCIAVPILFVPLSLGLLFYSAFRLTYVKTKLSVTSRLIMVLLMAISGVILSKHIVRDWLGWTFLNTTHGADQATINFKSWVLYFWDTWLIAPNGVLTLLATLVAISLGLSIMWRNAPNRTSSKGIIIAASGLMLLLSIFAATHRLWGFYLYTGIVVLISGIFIEYDDMFNEFSKRYKSRAFLAAAFLIAMVIILDKYWMQGTIRNLDMLAMRTSSQQFQKDQLSYHQTVSLLENLSVESGKKLMVMYSPTMFLPQNTSKYEIVEYWGPYTEWLKQVDVIVLGFVNTPGAPAVPQNSPEYPKYKIQQEGYAAHVLEKTGKCAIFPCFEKKLILPNGGEILTIRTIK